jgi:peptidyl-prolyl cis-trans isomerase C
MPSSSRSLTHAAWRLALNGCLLASLAICGAPGPALAATGGAAAARRAALVNGVAISAESFEHEVQRLERRSHASRQPTAVNRKQVLENLIVRELVYQEARKAGVQLAPGEVAAKLAQLKTRLADSSGLESTLGSMGLSVDSLEAQLAQGLVIEKYLEGIDPKGAGVSDQEVEHYYQDHPDEFREPLRFRLSHILVRVEAFWDDAAKERARLKMAQLEQGVRSGRQFAAVAREASECYSAKSGGDLGYFLPGQLGRMLEDAARELKPGEVSPVVEDRFGLHLLQVTELRPAGVAPLEQVRGKLRSQLRQEKLLKALTPVVKRLRAEAKVELLLNENE